MHICTAIKNPHEIADDLNHMNYYCLYRIFKRLSKENKLI